MSSAMLTLLDLAQQEVNDAINALGQARQAFVRAEQQLTLLLNYQDEYRQRLNQEMCNGIEAASWHNYHLFFLTLEQAIEQHRHQLNQHSARVAAATRCWQEKQQRLNAFSTLNQRAEQQLKTRTNKQDQKLTDEYAQLATMRKTQQ